MKLLITTILIYLIPLTLAQNDYQDDYLGGKTEVEDDYVFLPGKNSNNKPQKDSSDVGSEGSGSDIFQAGNEEVIDNDDEDYSDFDSTKFAGNSDDSGSGLPGIDAESDDETIYDDLEGDSSKNGAGIGIFKPELKGTTKDKSQFSEPGEDEEQPFEIEPYNPNSSDDFENDDVFKPSIPESPDNSEDKTPSENTKTSQNLTPNTPENETPDKSSMIPLPAWIDDFWGERWFVAALLGGAIVGFLIIVIVIIFICHAVRKKDEGSYIIDKDYKQGVDQTLRLNEQQPKANGTGAGGEYFA